MATLTANKNFLSPVGFQFKIDHTKYSNLEYFCTAVTLPDLTISASQVGYRGTNLSMSGDRLVFSPLSVTFNVTENMENYIEMFDWMREIAQVDNEAFKSDATLHILTSHNNVSKEIKFLDCFPVSLSSLEFNAQNTDIQYLQATIDLEYTYFEFV